MKKVPFGEFHPSRPVVNAIIENPAGSRLKFEFSEDWQAPVLNRVLSGGLEFPFNYGYVPMTRSGDGAHLDIFVVSSLPLPAQAVVPARPIGLVEVEDRGHRDNKVVAVPASDPAFASVDDWQDLPERLRFRLEEFYRLYPPQVGAGMVVRGFFGKDRAIAELRLAQLLD